MEVTIVDIAYGGKGIAKLDGCVIFIPGVLLGEVVKVEITKQHKNYADAKLLKIVTPSPARIVPSCPLAHICPSCCYQHVSYSEEVRLKQSQFVSLLQRMGKVDASLCLEPISSPLSTGYRNKITLHAFVEDKNVQLGYYGEDNRSIIDIPNCPLASEPINKLLSRMRIKQEFMHSLSTKGSVVLRYTEQDGALCWKDTVDNQASHLTESTPLGTLRVPRDAFFQINPSASPLLIKRVQDLVTQIKPQFLIDMYCGVGVFAFAAAQSGVPHVLGIDSQRAAIDFAKSNARYLGVNKTTLFLCDDADIGLEQAMEPVDAGQTTVIFDPPRKGLYKGTIQTISTAKPANIIYVSCAADTLARDIDLLKKADYKVVSTQLIDMFPRTQYFESITHLSLGA